MHTVRSKTYGDDLRQAACSILLVYPGGEEVAERKVTYNSWNSGPMKKIGKTRHLTRNPRVILLGNQENDRRPERPLSQGVHCIKQWDDKLIDVMM
jgi:hypothetical protein